MAVLSTVSRRSFQQPVSGTLYEKQGLAHWYLWVDSFAEGYGWGPGHTGAGALTGGVTFEASGRLEIEKQKGSSCVRVAKGVECEKCIHEKSINWGLRPNTTYKVNKFDCTDWVWVILKECDSQCCPKAK